MEYLFSHFNYVVVIVLMMTGLYVVFASRNLIKKLVGLSTFQTSVFFLYITLGKVASGQPPILEKDPSSKSGYDEHTAFIDPVQLAASGDTYILPGQGSEILYSNPLPHVLILTAIVVGVATLAIGLALTVRIREVYQTIEMDAIEQQDFQYNLEGIER
ncbi:sodium:proton antiporter [Algimonas ampicilliniresistens]|uniref:Sodium:proton antiporter n=1 Tax=Algimonas ampicilliniresistens TaxID=1298735 RepID=A0ABQ5V7V8_9PROT|nr:cation:proton antiporter subunit C [Algimonas ampicilliniresistens]GLQ22745.1 sodium:proton antiporter [Algimonas ampicilliniresistens]